ncbi:MAG: hypothetical protein GX495_04625 [Chloroflexi bacterium]|nr:hypothetical protein [Chloroflexota bacterium]
MTRIEPELCPNREMYNLIVTILRTINEILTAGIAITAFSLLLYALSFNLRDRVARSFAAILICVVIVFVAEAIGSVTDSPRDLEIWLRAQWLGITFLPAAYLHFSDALLATTGRPSRGRRSLAVRVAYVISFLFLLTLPFNGLVGHLVQDVNPAPHLQRTWLTWIFTLYYVSVISLSWGNLWRAYRRTVASASRRRMGYLLAGAVAPALGSYPYLLFGSRFAAASPLTFWAGVTLGNLVVSALLVLMAYAVAFFGVPWPDRVVKRRLFKWLMRGPVTASTVLALTTLVRRAGDWLDFSTAIVVPVLMVVTVLILEHLITLVAPIWEQWLFHGGAREETDLLQSLEERLLTRGDLHQFLEAVLAAVCDRLQTSRAFVAGFGPNGLENLVTIGGDQSLEKEDLSEKLLQVVVENGLDEEVFSWGEYWLIPLYDQEEEFPELLGLLGVVHNPEQKLDPEQADALQILTERAEIALRDWRRQQQVFSSIEALTPQVNMIQRLRAASRYSGTEVLTTQALPLEERRFSAWVKDALSHYWGGPKLTESPLLELRVVKQAMREHEDNPTNALRAILKRAIEQVRPEGERRFTAEWILYNILEMKFLEGRKVRDIAGRLAMSEADLYRKQRVAIEAVANAIVEMEQQARQDNLIAIDANSKPLDPDRQGGFNGK